VRVWRSYLICGVQRTGSWLLSHALEDTGVLGVPAEYFHRGDEQFWRDRWGATDEDAFLRLVQTGPATSNGVWASKMMWNYFGDALGRLRAWSRLGAGPDASDADVLAAAFPGLRYIWLRRADKLRQAVSWWRAAATGEFALGPGQPAGQPPAFDRDAIGRLVRYAQECEEGWRRWFPAHGIQPLEVEYEDLAGDLDDAVRAVAAFLEVRLPPGLERTRPRLRRQADHHTEEFVADFQRGV
jgi:trehalose 2-sulfotransferase